MSRLGKRLIATIAGVVLFIGIETVKSHFSSSTGSHQEPVTQADADLYMQVMRATADRIKNPTPADLRIVDDFSHISNPRTASANQLTDGEKETIWKAVEITSGLDGIVANDLHVDKGHYERVKDVVESALPPPENDQVEVSPQLTEAEKKALESKGVAIGSYAVEIKQLFATFYNNPLRKTVRGN